MDDITIYTATGYMVGPDVMMTAAHTVLGCEDYSVEGFDIYIKHNSGSLYQPNKRYWTTMYYSLAYHNTSGEYDYYDPEYDWAIFIMSSNVAAVTGYLGIGYQQTISNKAVSISGYPVADRYWQKYATGGEMDSFGPRRFTHNYFTQNGHSGAPVYDSSLITWGLHTDGGSPILPGYGVRYTSGIYDTLCTLIDEGRDRYGY